LQPSSREPDGLQTAREHALTCTAATAQAASARIQHSTQVTEHVDVILDPTSRLVRQMVHVKSLIGEHRLTAAAKGYLQMGGFRRSSLIQRLTSSEGNGFTAAQAEYAVSKVGR